MRNAASHQCLCCTGITVYTERMPPAILNSMPSPPTSASLRLANRFRREMLEALRASLRNLNCVRMSPNDAAVERLKAGIRKKIACIEAGAP